MNETLIFIDDGFLAKLSKHFGGNKYIKFDKITFSFNLAKKENLVPAIESLKEFDVNTILYTYYERGRKAIFSTSNELIKSVYKYVLLKKEDFINASFDKLNKENKNGQ